MEAAEATAVEAAILWLAQTIVETLQPGELDAWLHRVGLAGDIGELKSEVERMETVVNGVKGRAVGNKPLARSLARVKELMYDADDVVDELDYCRLQHKVAGVIMLVPASEPEGMAGDRNRDGAEQADASANNVGVRDNTGRKNRSKAWDHFRIKGSPTKAECIYCAAPIKVGDGTSGLHKHIKSCKKKGSAIVETPNRPSAGGSIQDGATISANGSEGRKRMRIEDSLATTTPPWNKANFFERIRKIARELGERRVSVIEYLNDSVASFDQYQTNNTLDTMLRTSGSCPRKVYGRNREIKHIMRAIKAAKSEKITVLPIVGIVGVGKTALAKLVYNDLLVKSQFERIWVWVSNIFDEVRVTREILDVVTLNNHEGSPRVRESYEGVSNYTKLQEVLKNHMARQPKKFLLVLDDVNDCMDDSQWKDLLDALGSSCRKGNVIIVTAKNLSIAQRLGTVEPVKLGALEDDDFRLLFETCAFGDKNNKEHLDIGYQIAVKLKGNPLAAESAAEMLREQPTVGHWKGIIQNGVWRSLQLRGGIVNTLKVSYYQLPYQLQQCFLFCSIFPNNHQFHIDDLVSMWISLGFVKSIEIGRYYFNALVNSCLLEQVKTKDSILLNKFYVMCGMMHEFARLVSRSEFATIDGLDCQEVLPTVLHLSILFDSVYHKDERGPPIGNMKFEEKMKNIVPSMRRLRTLILIGHYDSLFSQCFDIFMCGLVNCTHLRYLKIENKGTNVALPISLSNFYHLQVLDVGQPVVVDGASDLVNMRNLVLSKGACSLAWPACLQTIHLEDCEGCEILPSLERLSRLTKLKLRNMPQVTELSIPSLEELVFINMPKLDRCFCNSVRDLNSNLRVLEIRTCRVLKAFPLFESCEKIEIEQKSWLPNVNKLTVHECPHLMISNPLPPSSFCELSIKHVSTLPAMHGSSNGELKIGFHGLPSSNEFLDKDILSFHNLRTITRLEIVVYENMLSISLEGFRQLICLKRLEIIHCTPIFISDVTHEDMAMAAADFDALPSLECLRIQDCGVTGWWLSVILQHVQAIGELQLNRCDHVTGLSIEGKENSESNLTSAPSALSQGNPNRDDALTRPCPSKLLRIPSNLIPSLKKMEIFSCKLTFQGNEEGFSGFTSLEELIIFGCDELISSLVHEDEIDDQANGRWLLPCSLRVLDIHFASLEMLHPCFPGDLTCLTVLKLCYIEGLKSLQLHSCTALEKLTIQYCESLYALEGVRSLRSLRYLDVYGLPQCLESLSTHGYELCPRLERLRIDDPSFLTTPFCKQLTSLQCLQLRGNCETIDVAGLTSEEEAALQFSTSLQQLKFERYWKLSDLPVGLHRLPSLKRLEIVDCPKISRLPERGLPPSLEELEIHECSEELTDQCRMLATGKLKVIIDGNYVN